MCEGRFGKLPSADDIAGSKIRKTAAGACCLVQSGATSSRTGFTKREVEQMKQPRQGIRNGRGCTGNWEEGSPRALHPQFSDTPIWPRKLCSPCPVLLRCFHSNLHAPDCHALLASHLQHHLRRL